MIRLGVLLRYICLTLTSLVVQGCGHTPVSLTIIEAIQSRQPIDRVVLDPKLRYLRVSSDGKDALFVLGYLEPHSCGILATWYSGTGEVLQLCDGRIWSTAGLGVDWRSVKYLVAPPSWTELSKQRSGHFIRELDLSPGYKFSIRQSVSLREVASQRNARLVGISPDDLEWFEETLSNDRVSLPLARYGVKSADGSTRVLFGEQCLSENRCMAWQEWPINRTNK